jgi:periplasmic copper chaperone A
MRKVTFFVVLAVASFTLSSCVSVKELTITEMWARPGMNGGTSAAYFQIDNPSSQTETLLKADADISDAVEMHMTVPVGEGEMNGAMGGGEGESDGKEQSGGMQGMKMVPVDSVEIPKGSLEFKPGGLHVMFIGLKNDLKAGDNFTLRLTFENAGVITLDIPVKEY